MNDFDTAPGGGFFVTVSVSGEGNWPFAMADPTTNPAGRVSVALLALAALAKKKAKRSHGNINARLKPLQKSSGEEL